MQRRWPTPKSANKLGTGLPGGESDYDDLFYVADIEGAGAALNGLRWNIALDDADFLVVFPMTEPGTARLIGAVRHDPGETAALQWSDVNTRVIERLKLDISKVNWFSTYRVHSTACGGCVSRPIRISPRRRRAHSQPRWRSGNEHRHRRRGEPRLEARLA